MIRMTRLTDYGILLLTLFARDPRRPMRSARDLAEDLKRFHDDRPILARRASSVEQAWRWCRRNPLVASLLTAVLIVFAAVAVRELAARVVGLQGAGRA